MPGGVRDVRLAGTNRLDQGSQLLRILLPLITFFVVVPLLATATAKGLRLPADQRVTLTMITTARNYPIALAIAVAAFPDRTTVTASDLSPDPPLQ